MSPGATISNGTPRVWPAAIEMILPKATCALPPASAARSAAPLASAMGSISRPYFLKMPALMPQSSAFVPSESAIATVIFVSVCPKAGRAAADAVAAAASETKVRRLSIGLSPLRCGAFELVCAMGIAVHHDFVEQRFEHLIFGIGDASERDVLRRDDRIGEGRARPAALRREEDVQFAPVDLIARAPDVAEFLELVHHDRDGGALAAHAPAQLDLRDAVFILKRFEKVEVFHRDAVALEMLRDLKAQCVVCAPQMVTYPERYGAWRGLAVDSRFHNDYDSKEESVMQWFTS